MIDPRTSLIDLRAMVASGQMTAVEIATHYWDRSQRLNEDLNAFTWMDPGFVEQVEAAGEPVLPIGVKDVQTVAGQPNTKSSWLVDPEPASTSSLFIDRVLSAGFGVIGRTTSSELAATLTTDSVKHGVTRNPWHPEATPSGSSGGSAAAVAAGMVPVATGTDGAGSIRLPAVACNLVGLKVTRGLLPQREGPWDWSSVDGFLTRTVEDAALMIDLVDEPDPAAWVPPPPGARPSLVSALERTPPRLRIGRLMEPPNGATVQPDQAAATQAIADELADAGHQLRDLDPSQLRIEGIDGYRRVVAPTWSHLLDYDLEQPTHPSVAARLRAAEGLSAIEFVRATAALRSGVRETVRRLLEDVDLLLTPVTARPFPDHGVVLAEAAVAPDERPVTDAMRGFMDWVNVLGLPALALPTHRDGRGVPYGVQLIGAPHHEALLLRLGAELQRRYRWHDRRLPDAVS